MKTGDIVLIPFPFTDSAIKKIRHAVVITVTNDKYEDMVLSAISSVVPSKLSAREILIKQDKFNKLRIDSVIKVDRIVTLKKEDKIADLGRLNKKELEEFTYKFKRMID